MKPLPEAVQRAFPAPDGRLLERPWWKASYHRNGELSYQRQDEGPSSPDVYMLRPTASQVSVMDAQFPLPHPGYRAGQVWADDNGSSVVVCAFLYGTVWTSRDATGVIRADFARAWPYLMADPSCPHLAPWSPSEEKKP